MMIVGALLLCEAAGAEPRPRTLKHKTAQVRHLRRLIASDATEPHRIGGLLLRLARLELEVAILGSGSARPDLAGPVTTCRRLLAERPRYGRADEVRLFLARLELRRGRPDAALLVLDDLARLHPRSRQRCPARLVVGACHLARKDRQAARQAFQRALSTRCAAPIRRQARYQLAWTLLGAKRAAAGARELRRLCRDPGLKPGLRGRALADLALAWSLSPAGPDPDAARFLLAHAPSRGTARRLIREVGRRLLEAGRTRALIAFTRPVLDVPGLARLRALRIRALARGGPSRRLELELAAAGAALKQDRALRGEVSSAILALARRQPEGQARRLYRRLTDSYGGTPAAGAARLYLGQLLLREGKHAPAAAQLALAAKEAPRAAQRALAFHLRVCALERVLDSADPDERRTALARFVGAARAFAAQHPDADEGPEVMLALGSRLLLERGREREAVAVLSRLTNKSNSKPGPAVRRQALQLLVTALTRAGLHRRAYRTATGRLSGGCSDRPHCRWLRRAAARAARLRSRRLAVAGNWAGAHRWVVRAAADDPSIAAKERRRLLLAAATLAARAGEEKQAEAHLTALLEAASSHAQRREIWVERARQREARGQLAEAAAVYRTLAENSPTLSGQLGWLEKAASNLALGGAPARAARAARRLRKLLRDERLPSRLLGRWQLRVGRVLERVDPRAAYLHYYRQAHRLWRQDGRAAAVCLVRAAGLAPTPEKARRLHEQARVQAGALRRKGKIVASAARARLGLAVTARTRLAPPLPPVRRVQVLHEAQGPLVELMQKPADPAWSAAAALELARNQAALARALQAAPLPSRLSQADRRRFRSAVDRRVEAIGEVRARLLGRLAAAARTDRGLGRHTLAAAREISGARAPRWRLPGAGSPAASILPLHTAGRHGAAERAATAALAVHGPDADLLCSRAVARLALDRPREALRDLRRALKLRPDSRCVRANLDRLDRLRGLAADEAMTRRELP